jgi:hypothetical protein
MQTPTIRDEDEKELHRTRIAIGDLNEAIAFINAADALTGVDPKTDVTHRALVCAAVIYYARPFLHNEHRNEKKRPPDAAASLIELTDTDLRDILADDAGLALHKEVMTERSKIVAHAESEFFKLDVTPAEWVADEKVGVMDINFRAQRTHPAPDLNLLRRNATTLHAYLVFQTLVLLERLKAKGGAADGAGGSAAAV